MVQPPWQDLLNPQLTQRLLQPMVRPGVIPDTLALAIFERSRQFKQRLRLLHHFQQRWDKQSVLAIPDVPIVYADWVLPGTPLGESIPAASTTAALQQTDTSPLVSRDTETASTQPPASATSRTLIIQAKFANPPALAADTGTPIPVASDSALSTSPIPQFITQLIPQTMGQSMPQIITQKTVSFPLNIGDGNSALTPSASLPIVTPSPVASRMSDSVAILQDAVLQNDQKDLPLVKVTNSAAQSTYSSANSQVSGKPHPSQFPAIRQPLVLARPAVGSLPTDTTLPEMSVAAGNRFSGRSPTVSPQPTVTTQPTLPMPSSASVSLPASPQPPPVDVSRLTQQVERKLMRKLTVERERRGQRTW